MTGIRSDFAFIRALNRFERAVLRYDELGSIPVVGQDREEQELIDVTRDGITTEYERAREALLNLIDRRLAP